MLVILDCDGTLIDPEIIASAIDAEALTRLGRPTTPAEFSRLAGDPLAGRLDIIKQELGRPLPDGFLEEMKRSRRARFRRGADGDRRGP